VEKLFQLPTEEKEIAREVDLSLAACRAVIERHDWVMTAESPPDGGLLFVIEHPVVEETDEEPHAELPAQLVESAPSESPAKPAANNILIVDDEEVVIELLDYYLRSEGHAVETSRDGRDALKKLKQKDYDLIFCDLKMPGLSGQELFQWLEANKPEMARRVIFITGDVATPATMAFLKKPQKRWLEKPFDLTELRQVIGEVLS
jgi:CheY-like chemotaxis protein